MLRLAINGFGRIGRTTLRVGWNRKGVEFVAVNDLTEPATLAHLLKYDSVFRAWNVPIKAGKDFLMIGKKKILVFAQMDPSAIPWGKHKVDVVIESTGRFTKTADAEKHLQAGAKKVVISAPSDDAPTFLMGVNHTTCKKDQNVVNNASCTTNSVGPVTQILIEKFGVKKAMMTTIHSVTAEQNIVDGLPPKLHPDLRRARSALVNIVPTSTGAAKTTTKVVTSLEDKFDGIAVRVPTIDVSLTDFTFLLNQKTTVEEVNELFRASAKLPRWKKILGVTDEPLVSTDFIQSPYGTVVDLKMTRLVDGDLLKVLAWYDNEWGYCERLIDMAMYVGSL
jgi:glyceraldehyde 3-phosphate dehydrogenase